MPRWSAPFAACCPQVHQSSNWLPTHLANRRSARSAGDPPANARRTNGHPGIRENPKPRAKNTPDLRWQTARGWTEPACVCTVKPADLG